MFTEPHFNGQRIGWIEVICGSMFSGKTEELIRRLKRAKIANQRVKIFKPVIETRYHEANVVSHDLNSIHAKTIGSSDEMFDLVEDAVVIGIDEAQFFDIGLINICQQLALKGIRIIVAGLDMDYLGNPYGPIPGLLAVAEYITKVHAICPHCGNLATHSYRLIEDDNQILLGAANHYEPRCRVCFSLGNSLVLDPVKL